VRRDKNFQQVVHNLPLVLLGYATPPRYLRALLSAPPSGIIALALVATTFILDPFYFGAFPKPAERRGDSPVLIYLRAAFRLAGLFACLPRRRVRWLTDAGHSQLFAYLFHDAAFTLLSLAYALFTAAVHGAFYDEHAGGGEHPTKGATGKQWRASVELSWALAGSSFTGAVTTALAAAATFLAYMGACLLLQVSLSQPRAAAAAVGRALCPPRGGVCVRVYARARLALLAAARACCGGGYKYKPLAAAEEADR